MRSKKNYEEQINSHQPLGIWNFNLWNFPLGIWNFNLWDLPGWDLEFQPLGFHYQLH